MITDQEIDQLAKEFKEWRKQRERRSSAFMPVSNGTLPLQVGESRTYRYEVLDMGTIKTERYEQVTEIVSKIESIADGLIDACAMNMGLSLKSEVQRLKKILLEVKE